MSCDRGRLQELVDGELEGAAREEAERHARSCPGCRRELAALRSLVARARSLPERIEPERDLWPRIEARLAPRGFGRFVPDLLRGPAGRRRLAWAAVLALLALGAPLLYRLPIVAPAPETTDSAAVPPPALEAGSAALLAAAERAHVEDGVLRTRQDLHELLELRRPDLGPETAAVLQENLRLIDEAIGEIRSALARDPENRRLSLLLASQYRQEVSVLRRIDRT